MLFVLCFVIGETLGWLHASVQGLKRRNKMLAAYRETLINECTCTTTPGACSYCHGLLMTYFGH